MNIFLVSFQFEGNIINGEGVHVRELARELIKKSHNVTVLTLGTKQQLQFENVILEDPYDKNKGNQKIKVPTYRFFVSDSPYLNTPYDGTFDDHVRRIKEFDLQVLGFLRAQKNQSRSIVHLHGRFMIPSLAKEIKLYTKFKIVSSLHRIESMYNPTQLSDINYKRKSLLYLENKELLSVKYSNAVIVRSNLNRDLLSELFSGKIQTEKIHVLPSAVPMPFIHRPIPAPKIVDDFKSYYGIKGDLIFNLSVIEPVKSIEYTIQAVPLIHKKLRSVYKNKPENFTYIIAGLLRKENSDYYNRLQKLAAKVNKKYKNSIRIMPNIDEKTKEELFDTSSVFLYSSLIEPFGITMAEAIVKDNVIIASNTEGARLLLNKNKNIKAPFSVVDHGIIVPYFDMGKRAEFFAKAVLYAFTHRKELEKVKKLGQNYVLKQYAWSTLVKKKIEIYKSVLHKK